MGEDKSERKRRKSEGGEDVEKKKKKKKRESEGDVKKDKKKSRKSVEGGDGTSGFALDRAGDRLTVDPSFLSPIAEPLADAELSKKVFELIKKAAKGKMIRRGIREVAKAIRKGQKGVCVFAGDVFPVDVIAHLPLACEEASIPYCFVAQKELLGNAALTKRPTSVLLVTENSAKSDFAEEYKECKKSVKSLE